MTSGGGTNQEEGRKERPGAADSYLQASKDLAIAYYAYIYSCKDVQSSSGTILQVFIDEINVKSEELWLRLIKRTAEMEFKELLTTGLCS